MPSPEGPTEVIETDYEIGQHNISHSVTFDFDVHKPVFLVSSLTIIIFTIATLTFQTQLEPVFTGMRNYLTAKLDWFFLLSGDVFVLVALALAISPLGSIRIGGPDATPDYSRASWLAMLFAAGMGIGLVFYGVSEPMSHYESAIGGITMENGLRTDWAPLGGAEGNPAEARQLAMAATLYHWALHPWAMYALVALSLAIFAYNKGLPMTMRSVFYPLLGERIWGWPGHVIDILAIIATIFGLATSLGYGAEQATAGLGFLFGIPAGMTTKILLIVAITFVATISVVAGMDNGVKRLSEFNMVMAFALLLFVLFAGPTLAILTGIWESAAAYARDFIPLSNPFGRTDDNYRQGWTAFYWAWWISWSPFVGMFIARVSRGRSVREFILTVLIVPSVVCLVWFTTFGGTALSQVADGFSGVLNADLELKLFEMLSQLPLTEISSLIGIILVMVFFITSADSGSLVVDTIAAGGKLNAPTPQRVLWASFSGLLAIALLLGGGLAALQAMAVSTGFPFTLVLLAATWALVKGLQGERREVI
ncbi:BCCT family transporter [Paracoccus fistulariae]|nr:BCCT family transporter [Paracoccus fistulariae]MDB6182810.1 BCCT family transporter [Paracoccus fistulariae]